VKISSFEKIIDFVLPSRCPVTGDLVDSQGMVSPEAWKALSFITAPFCARCGHPFEFALPAGAESSVCPTCLKSPPAYQGARSALVYDDNSRGLILGFKHGDQTHTAVAMVPWLVTAGRDFWKDADVIVPVPLHWTRLLRRRYNQSAVLGARVAKEVGISFLPDALARIRRTPVQGHLSATQRHKNVAHAFNVPRHRAARIVGKVIVLVDDVYTTGATVNECAKALLDAGAVKVYVLTLAKALK
jgi:ComF family protein